MTEDEYNQFKRRLEFIAEQQKKLKGYEPEAEDRFAIVEKGIADLLAACKKRISETDEESE